MGYGVIDSGDRTLVVLGDKTSGWDETRSDIVDGHINAISPVPDAIISVGDTGLEDNAEPAYGFSDCMDELSAWISGGKFWTCVGNHDITDVDGTLDNTSAWQTFYSYSSEYYKVTLGLVDFFFLSPHLNSAEDGYWTYSNLDTRTAADFIGSTQGTWITEQLAASGNRWKIVVFHNPSYSSSSNDGLAPCMRQDWAGMGVDLVLYGHAHFYERLWVDTGSGYIPHIQAGTSGISPQANTGNEIEQSVVRINSVTQLALDESDPFYGSYNQGGYNILTVAYDKLQWSAYGVRTIVTAVADIDTITIYK